MPKRWLIRPHDRQLVADLERQSGVSSILAQLLAARGLVDPAEVKRFLTGTLSDLRDPETLPGVPEAADRLLAAARAVPNLPDDAESSIWVAAAVDVKDNTGVDLA